MSELRFIDFFAGIGGMRHGLELAGHRCLGFCEWDKYAVASYTSMYLITEEQREHLSGLNLKKRQKEILRDEYRNGEWYADDIRRVDAGDLPGGANCWCFGAPCQDFSVAGRRAGLAGDRSSLVREIFRLLEEQEEQDRPEWLIYENVKGMLSSNRGLDYLSIVSEMDRLGYDIQWQNINSSWYVPQNRERIYTIGHLRRFGPAEILPIEAADGENRVQEIGRLNGGSKCLQTYSPDGIAGTISTVSGGGNEPHVAQFCDLAYDSDFATTENARTLLSRYYKGPAHFKGNSGVLLKLDDDFTSGSNFNSRNTINGNGDTGRTLISSSHSGNEPKVAIPVCSPEVGKKDQNGRIFKENGDPSFAITARDRHGVAVKVKEATKQGYAEADVGDCINLEMPDSKTRRGRVGKQIANTLDTDCNQGVVVKCDTLGVIDAQGRAEKAVDPKEKVPTLRAQTHGNVPEVVDAVGSEPGNEHEPMYVELEDGVIAYAIWYEKYQCYVTIRKLTPRECFRLQGFSDELFDRAQFVNSDSQLYKQAGNAVTVNVAWAVGEKIREVK